MDVNGNWASCVEDRSVTQDNQTSQQYQHNFGVTEQGNTNTCSIMTKDEPDADLPGQDQAKEFYATYEPRDILGKGLSSTVRRVVEKSTGKQFAVKIIDISGERDTQANIDQLKTDTIREVNILRTCAGHPNIIELHDFYETPTFLFLVFELCRQGELFDYLTREVSLSEKRTRFFMHQLFDVVSCLHSKKIVHRDLKPENILLDDNMNIKVSDFGFATAIPEDEPLTELLGTPGYLAPEVLTQAMNEDHNGGYGLEVDLWACGVIMFTLLCGAPPFWHRKQMYMLRDIMAGNYSFSSPLWSDVSELPKDLINQLLVVDPAVRLTARQALEHPFFQRDIRLSLVGTMKTLQIVGSRFHAVQNEPTFHDTTTSPRSRRLRAMSGKGEHIEIQTQVNSLPLLAGETEVVPEKVFQPRKVFRSAVLAVRFFFRLRLFHLHPPPVSAETVQKYPYQVKQFRRLIDACAFNMYAHWVKRGENQNRAALFEHQLRDDWKTVEVSA